jgi:hypothetical protein
LARAPENFQTVSQLVTESIVLVRKEPALNKGLFFFQLTDVQISVKIQTLKKKIIIKKTTGKTFTKQKQ